MWILIALFTLYSQKDSVHRNDCWEQLSSNARYLDAATYIQDNPPRANRAQLHVPAFTQLLGSRREGTRLIQCSWCTYYFIFQGTVEMRIGKAQTIKAQFLKVRKALFWHTLGFERRNLWEWDYEEMENIVFTSVVNNQRTLFSPVSPQDHMKQMKSRTSEAEFLRGAILSIIIVRWSKHSFQSNPFFFWQRIGCVKYSETDDADVKLWVPSQDLYELDRRFNQYPVGSDVNCDDSTNFLPHHTQTTCEITTCYISLLTAVH